MGGSDKTQTPAASVATAAGSQPRMVSFGGDSGILAQQLAAGGLLGAVGNPSSFYQPVSVPLIENPAMLQAYMQSMGMPYQANDGSTVAAPVTAKPSTGTSGVGVNGTTTTKKNPDVIARRGSDR